MAWYRIAENVLDAIANAINAKTGHTAPMTPVEMVLEIQSIPTGGSDTIQYTIANDYSVNSITALSFFSTLLQAVGTEEYMGYQNNIDPTDTTYTRLLKFFAFKSSATDTYRIWKYYRKGSTTPANASGSDDFNFAAGTTFTIYKGWTQL